jgi:hypothetical protein
MMESNPDAIFDALYISRNLQRKIDDFSMYEVQFFSYFACLLSLYDGNAVDSWNYGYIKTEFGSPYSSDIHKAVTILKINDFFKEIDEANNYFVLTEKGDRFLSYQEDNIASIVWRRKYLNAACESISLLPLGNIKEALNDEPVLSSAGQSTSKKNLLQDTNPATKVLYSQFKSLRAALEGKYDDIIIPAVVWIQALVESTKKAEA